MSITEEPKKLQLELASKVILKDQFELNYRLGAMDVSCQRFDPKKMVYGVCVTDEECSTFAHHQPFPYIPGYLSFREAPALISAFNQLKKKPTLLFVDGQGISHPRGLGIASHIGVMLDIPTIGIAKSILVGTPIRTLGEKAGSFEPIVYKDKVVGILYRSKIRSNPIVISQGHRVSLNTAYELVKKEMKGYRLPEPIRKAHMACNTFRKSFN